MPTALALLLSVNHATTKAVEIKANLVVGTVFIFMYAILESTDCAKEEFCVMSVVNIGMTAYYDVRDFINGISLEDKT